MLERIEENTYFASQHGNVKESKNVSYLLGVSFIYTCIYLAYGLFIQIHDLGKITDDFEFNLKILYITFFLIIVFSYV